VNRYLHALFSFVALSASATVWSAPSMLGDQVTIRQYFPNLSTLVATQTVTVVSPGAEITCPSSSVLCASSGNSDGLLDGESLNLEALSISGNFVAGFASTSFNGYVFDDLDFGPDTGIVGLTLTTTIANLALADISFDTNTVWVNLTGAGGATGGAFTIDLSVAPAAIPEPSALALAGIALAGLGAANRRRKQKQ
jgi:hypothetical protein